MMRSSQLGSLRTGRMAARRRHVLYAAPAALAAGDGTQAASPADARPPAAMPAPAASAPAPGPPPGALDAEAGAAPAAAPCADPKCSSGRYDRLWSAPPAREEAHGPAGRAVQRLGVCGYGLFVAVPVAFVALVFAIVPLGDPTRGELREQWVFLFLVNLAVFALFTFLYSAAFLSAADRERPFRQHFAPIFAVLAGQLALFAPPLLTTGTFDYIGIAALALFFLELYVTLWLAYPEQRAACTSFFRRFVLLVALYVPILVGYIIAFRETGSLVQSLLNFAIAFLTFIYRRIMLSRLDPFPLEIAQLFAGLWVQNMFDSVAILAFPQVDSPGVLFSAWAMGAFGNVAFLVFVSDVWIFKIRPPLKNGALNAFKGNFHPPPPPAHDHSFDPLDRGHSANVGGYRRRQFRFFFFRLLSQAVSMVLYLSVSPMLRWGSNREYAPFSSSGVLVGGEEYRNSMIYAGVNLLFIMGVMVAGYAYLRNRHHQTFHEIREIHVHDLANHTRVGLIVAILTHNMLFALGIIMSPYCVFSAFKNCRYDRAFAG